MSETPLTLIFESDNVSNTNIYDLEDGRILYQVTSQEEPQGMVSRVRNLDGETIASWVWRDVRSDVITLGDGSPVSVSAWLRKSVVPFKDTVTFQDFHGRSFKWKGNGPGMSLELYAGDDKRQPIAKYQKRRVSRSSPSSPNSEVTPARLFLDRRGEEIRDLVVISFLVLEKSRRAAENSTLNRAESLAQPMMGGRRV